MDMETIFVAEKGKGALTKLKGDQGTSGKGRVIGKKVFTKKPKSKSAPKDNVGELSKKIAKFTPHRSGKATANAKKSTRRLASGKTPSMQTPHDKDSAVSANVKTMAQFKEMVKWMQRAKSGKAKTQKVKN